ncbi:methyltransferase family protein [Pontibacter ummariensis]|uniref:Methyltransferase domain-containing protein n=1 Tax=Pontibacter ummariensis TaxID=1610492 RepID=A0A239ILF8_9BACT|nr:class I SAM-dependent methyltransferase [Pontibacter ummariensis]PRY09891.1 methyltransferase family protein [Pontibacter ummariensis]SNS94058.1 Methyltransferase domain-containing protein [Pontibacter ummariensis]
MENVLKILKCPISNQVLVPSQLSGLADNNTLRLKEELATIEDALNEKWDQKGLITPDRKYFYPIIDNIFILLPELCITSTSPQVYDTKWDRQRVQMFYNQFGWKKTADNEAYEDTKIFVDQREIAKEYQVRAEERIKQYLSSGTYLLDIASGALHNERYHNFSRNYQYRVCIDFSITALIEARKNIGSKHGIFILGDITNIPLQDDACDNVISLHTLYHVHKDKQETALKELVRVCKPEANIVIAYNWGWHSLLMNISLLPTRAIKMIRKIINDRMQKSLPKDQLKPTLYFYPHSMSWFNKVKAGNWHIEYNCQKSLHVDFIRLYIHQQLGGEHILKAISDLEDKYPNFFGKYGSFPLIIIRKKDSIGLKGKTDKDVSEAVA